MKLSLCVLIAAVLVAISAPLVAADKAKCPVANKEIEVTAQTPRVLVQGKPVYFCCANCPKAFAKAPEKFIKSPGTCPVISGDIAAAKADERVVVNNNLWYVCCPGCADGVKTNTVVLKELEDVVSRKKFRGTPESPQTEFMGQLYFFESPQTKAAFLKEPARFAVVYGK